MKGSITELIKGETRRLDSSSHASLSLFLVWSMATGLSTPFPIPDPSDHDFFVRSRCLRSMHFLGFDVALWFQLISHPFQTLFGSN